MRCKNNIMYR